MQIRVLIFDDEDSIRNILTTVLKIRGYEIFSYKDPSECSIYTSEKCDCGLFQCSDIIITDIQMPITNGIDFINNLSSKKCKVNNILVISGGLDYYDINGNVEKNIKFLQKPFSIHEISKILEEFEKNINPSRNLIHI
jgi:DNA-binding NtrC family response regulator